MTDYVSPKEVVHEILAAAKKKADLSIRDMILRGILAGAFLGYATSLAVAVTSQGMPPILGAILFPVGFVILVLLGLELATGNFALLPAGLMAGEVSFMRLLRNWGWVYIGNLIGCVFYAALFYLAVTNCGASGSASLGDLLKQAAQKKTLGYMSLGASGWASAFIKGILCNWMVTLGAVLAMVSRSTIGKIVAMWLPIMTFFALGYEHSIVNMFVIPAGMMFGASVSTAQWLFWNQLPVTIGNIFSGALFTGAALYLTYGAKQPSAASEERIAVIRQPEAVTVLAQTPGMNPM
jgi:formate transporter